MQAWIGANVGLIAGVLQWSAIINAAIAIVLIALAVAQRRRGRYPVFIGATLAALIGSLALHQALQHRVGSQRLLTLQAMAERANDPWPRGSGHVPLGAIGAGPWEKGYIEPGGGFSPAAGTFGVSFWVLDIGGRPVATGDDIPLSATAASYGQGVEPSIDVRGPSYLATWRASGPGRFSLRLENISADHAMAIVFRGVGPAGGGLREIDRLGPRQFLLNGRWKVTVDRPLAVDFLGKEGGGWLDPRPSLASHIRDRAGWGVLRLRLPKNTVTTLIIEDSQSRSVSTPDAEQPVSIGLPGIDEQFDASLKAQRATLRQSIIGQEIAPGDPLNYPLPWLRDGAYVLVAMARAGDTERLRALGRPFAERDFFGGFGAEADAPGLALWALNEVSVALQDPEYDREIFPHIVRKVELIRRMLDATGPVLADYTGPIVPKYRGNRELRLVAEASKGGLIDGRMDWLRPKYYVNAMSYAGLNSAIAIAARTGHRSQAANWEKLARRIRVSWQQSFDEAGIRDPQVWDDRTAISGLWPSEIAAKRPYEALLERRWTEAWDTNQQGFRTTPKWTYFTVGEAHQWLRLQRPDRVWGVLRDLWKRQPAPGLYTLWEGDREENSFGIWRNTRGWVQPRGVTPHYWASAEMLLLQLAMLADVQGSDYDRALVVGAGVPKSWLGRTFAVGPIGTSEGPVSWSWDGKIVRVQTPSTLSIRLGPAFPAGTAVKRLGTPSPPSALVPIAPKLGEDLL
jgi:hypothetical protein